MSCEVEVHDTPLRWFQLHGSFFFKQIELNLHRSMSSYLTIIGVSNSIDPGIIKKEYLVKNRKTYNNVSFKLKSQNKHGFNHNII